ncbi:MAG: hypothetical protein IPG72_14490 [Ardenticatenales bacterium]|nr:hypothetical protein [Ardenticatenales bacterium]
MDTLRALSAAHPDAELHFVVGLDSFLDLPNWHAPSGIAALAQLAVVDRLATPPLPRSATCG